MRIVRFKTAGKVRFGVVEGTHVVEYAGTPFGPFRRGRKKYPLRQTVLLVPVVPSKIVAVGLNYRDHAEEMRLLIPTEPRIFFKPPSALCGPDDPIVYPACSGRVDFEAEEIYRTYKIAEDARPYREAAAAIRSVGVEVVPRKSGGGTDGNYFNAKGIPCVALATGMVDEHATSEHIAVDDLVTAAHILTAIVTQPPLPEEGQP